ncbi:35352_t:CDS:2, partial [Gigaspora margarita]
MVLEIHNRYIVRENNSKLVEDQPVNSSLSDQNSVEAIEAPVVEQQFHNWNELDCFISLYAKSQNFVSVICGSEYDKRGCQIHRYACEYQGYNSTKNLELQSNSTKLSNSTESFDLTEQSDSIEQFDSTEALDIFIEDTIDALAILLIITVSNCAAFHIMLISKRWYNNERQVELEFQTQKRPFIIGLDSTKDSSYMKQLFYNLSFHLPNISFSNIYFSINNRKAYVAVNRLSKKAIQTELNAGTYAVQELEDFINSFIFKHAPKKKRKNNSQK